MKFIKKTYPINRSNDDKKATYEISDNLLRFYYTYIYKYKSILEMIDASIFYDKYIEKSITTFISYRFEDIVKDYFKINNDGSILNIGSYYYDDPKNKKNGEFDVVLQKEEGYIICEVKYYTKPITEEIINEEKKQVALINELKIIDLIFASSSGFSFENSKYITGKEIYSISKK